MVGRLLARFNFKDETFDDRFACNILEPEGDVSLSTFVDTLAVR